MILNKEQIKKEAEKLAAYFGYDTSKMSLELINALEMYCQGYLQGVQDAGEYRHTNTSAMDKTQYEQAYDDENPDYIRQSQEEI